MTTIYVCESGCIHEGGVSFYASTDLKKARSELKKAMELEVAWAKRLGFKDIQRLVGKWHWVLGTEYFLIREFKE